MWRYREVLPVEKDENIVSLGEGWTPLLPATKLAALTGIREIYIKDEAQNPTQSFKARGMAAAVSMAKELGATKLAVPSAGNAAGALAAYAARAGLQCFIFMPLDTPRANVVECEETGASVTLMDGLITDCGAEVARRKEAEGWFDVSTLKEPYRVEGKKTMGYEIAEQLNWHLPDVIIYPTGGGTGLATQRECLELLGCYGTGKVLKLDSRMLHISSYDFKILRMDCAAGHHFRSLCYALGHQHRFGKRGRSVIHGSIGHFHSRQLANERLEFENRLQRTLRYFRLVRSVRRKKFRTRNDVIDYGRDVMLVGAGAEEADPLCSSIASPELLKSGEKLDLGKCGSRV